MDRPRKFNSLPFLTIVIVFVLGSVVYAATCALTQPANASYGVNTTIPVKGTGTWNPAIGDGNVNGAYGAFLHVSQYGIVTL